MWCCHKSWYHGCQAACKGLRSPPVSPAVCSQMSSSEPQQTAAPQLSTLPWKKGCAVPERCCTLWIDRCPSGPAFIEHPAGRKTQVCRWVRIQNFDKCRRECDVLRGYPSVISKHKCPPIIMMRRPSLHFAILQKLEYLLLPFERPLIQTTFVALPCALLMLKQTRSKMLCFPPLDPPGQAWEQGGRG